MMEPDVQPTKAKRRISPTLITSPGSSDVAPGFSSSPNNAINIFTPNGEVNIDIELEAADISNKKRGRESSDLTMPYVPKKARNLGGTGSATPTALEPFYFLVTTSPRYWACAYESLCDWIQRAINSEISVSENPFSLTESQQTICLSSSSPVRDSWLNLIGALNTKDRLEELWIKFTVIDKVLTMFGDEEWNERNLNFFSLQHNVWWVEQVQPWFAISHVRTHQEYLQLALSALVLELWWRFIWARFTQKLFLEKAPVSATQNLNNAPPDQMATDDLLLDNDDSNDVLDQSDLGEGTDTESEVSQADLDFEHDLKDEDITKHDESSVLAAFFSAHYQSKDKCHNITRNDEEESSSESEDSSSSGERSPPRLQDIIGETSFKMPEDGTDNHTTVDWFSEIPPATSLFFSHSQIGDALDQIEKQFWISDRWDCRVAFDTLLQMVIERTSELQLPEQPLALVISQIAYAYERIFIPFLQNMGVQVTRLETETEENDASLSSLPLVWNFDPAFGDYWVDTVMRVTFNNLSSGGMVPAVHFIGLFPTLLLNADAKSDALVSRVVDKLHAKLVSRGEITPELESLVKTLDSLTAEKNALLRQDNTQRNTILRKRQTLHPQVTQPQDEMEDADVPFEWDMNSLDGRLHGHRMQRVKQIDAMLDEIRADFNRLTGAIDQVQSKRRRKTKPESSMDMANFTSSPINGPQTSDLPSDEALWGLPSLDPEPTKM